MWAEAWALSYLQVNDGKQEVDPSDLALTTPRKREGGTGSPKAKLWGANCE